MLLEIDVATYAELLQVIEAAEERISFLFTHSDARADADDSASAAMALQVCGVWHLDDQKDYVRRTPSSLEVADQVRPALILRAHEAGAGIAEAHWHGGRLPAEFSSYDVTELTGSVGQLLWRLPDRPYVALVFGNGTFDALVWTRPDTPQALEGLRVDGHLNRPTNSTLKRLARLAALRGDDNANGEQGGA
jgi:hypothetical protein